jgi:ATP-dependent DNA helicase RecQ
MAQREEEIRGIGREVFGWGELHSGIAEAAAAVSSGRDVLAVMPTGYGKSGVYELAGVALGGVTVIVSPLIALQADQLAHLEEAGLAAVALNSTQGARATRRNWQAIDEKRPVFVLLSPEQLADDEVTRRLAAAGVSLIAVDEAQCVSLWGDDFRPDYGALRERAEALGRPPVVALTATGSPPVREDIVERLGLRDPLVVARGFDRPNLRLEVVRHEDDREKRRAVIEQVAGLEGPGLVYVATRRDALRYAEELSARGIRATGYHGSRPAGRRQEVHEGFTNGEVDVVVATSAFGMGIDKADVRFVVHADVPGSPDQYYQEIGRAGRDGRPALASLHYRPEDFALTRFFNGGLPDPEPLAEVLRAMADSAGRRTALAKAVGSSPRALERRLRLLEEADAIVPRARGYRLGRLGPEEAVESALDVARRRQRIDASRLEMMRALAETLGCRRQELLAYFGEHLPEPCGNCDSCSSGTAYERDDERAEAAAGPFRLHQEVEHEQWGHGVVMRAEGDRVTVYFDAEGYKVLSVPDVEESGVLQHASFD